MPGVLTQVLAALVLLLGLALLGLGYLLRTRGGVGPLADPETADLGPELAFARTVGSVTLTAGACYVVAGLLVGAGTLSPFGGWPLYLLVTVGYLVGLGVVRGQLSPTE